MKFRIRLLPTLLLLSSLLVAALGGYIKCEILEPLGIQREESIIAMPFVLYSDKGLQFMIEMNREMMQNAATESTEAVTETAASGETTEAPDVSETEAATEATIDAPADESTEQDSDKKDSDKKDSDKKDSDKKDSDKKDSDKKDSDKKDSDKKDSDKKDSDKKDSDKKDSDKKDSDKKDSDKKDSDKKDSDKKDSDKKDSDKKDSDKKDPDKKDSEEEATEPVYVELEDEWFDTMLVIGDSRFQGMRNYYRFGEAYYFTSIGMNIYNVFGTWTGDKGHYECSLDETLKTVEFDKVLIGIGLNECNYEHSYIEAGFRKLIDLIHEKRPDAKIILSSIMMVSKSYSKLDPCFKPKNLKAINEIMKSLAEEDELVYYLETNGWIVGDGKYLPDEVTFDGVHFYGTQYVEWAKWMRKEMGTLGIP